MKNLKLHICAIFILIPVLTIYSQRWVPKYSTNGMLDSPIHGYADSTNNNPWAVAEDLISPFWMVYSQMGMAIDTDSSGATQTGCHIRNEVMNIDFENNNDSYSIKVHQHKITDRDLLSVQFLDANNDSLSIDLSNANISVYSGRVYIYNSGNYKIKVNADGLMMFKIYDTNIKKVKIKMHFHPGYYESSPKIPQNGQNSIQPYNKADVSHLAMDEYGGYGIYLLDNEKEYYDATGTYPEVTYSIPQNNRIFWISVFPPKEYDWDTAQDVNRLVQTNWFVNTALSTAGRPVDGPWYLNDTEAAAAGETTPWNPDTSYWMLNDQYRSAISTYINSPPPGEPEGLNNGYFVHFGDMALWENWQFEYIPRKTTDPTNPYELLNFIDSDLNTVDMKYIVYTSPQFFLKTASNGGRYSKTTNPFTGFGYSPSDLDDINSPAYDAMLTFYDNFTFNGEDYNLYQQTNMRVPILINYNMFMYDTAGTTAVDLFMQETKFPAQTFTPANREGENYSEYLDAINDLKTNVPGLDGIYLDGTNQFNIPRSYQLYRELKETFGDNFVLFRHASNKEGQDAYLPQIDAYADFVLAGENNNNNNYYDRRFFRYFISTQNISNSVAVLYHPEHIEISEQQSFFNWLMDYNVRLMYPALKNNADASRPVHTLIANQTDLVNSYWDYFDAVEALNQRQSRVDTNLSYHQNQISLDYAAYQSTNVINAPANANVLKGDVDGNGTEEIILKDNNNYYFYSRFDDLNCNITLGASGDQPYIGDFNGDSKSDIALINSSTQQLTIYYSQSNSESIIFSSALQSVINIPANTLLLGEEILVGNFTEGDHINDMVTFETGTWKVFKFWYDSTQTQIGGFYGTAADYYVSNFGSTGDIKLVGNFDGNDYDDIAFYHAATANWAVRFSDGESFSSSNDWAGSWGSANNDEPLIGNFDGGYCDDLMIHRIGNGDKWLASLSNWESGNTFDYVDPDSTWSDNIGDPVNITEIPFCLDFNGDGYDDYGIYRIDSTANNLIVALVTPGEIISSATGRLPKEGAEIPITLTYQLVQNYPNPFNPATTIKYSIPDNNFVTLKVYNIIGQEVATLVNGYKTAGSYTVNFNASKLASGIYIYRIQSGNFTSSRKLILLK